MKHISNDVEKWFDTSNYNENEKRLLPVVKNKKVDDGNERKKSKGTKSV